MAEKGQAVFLALLDMVRSELSSKICKYEVKLTWEMNQKIIQAWPTSISKWPHPHIIKPLPFQHPLSHTLHFCPGCFIILQPPMAAALLLQIDLSRSSLLFRTMSIRVMELVQVLVSFSYSLYGLIFFIYQSNDVETDGSFSSRSSSWKCDYDEWAGTEWGCMLVILYFLIHCVICFVGLWESELKGAVPGLYAMLKSHTILKF